MLRYQGKFYVPNIDNLRTNIIAESHGSRYFIHIGSTMMYHDLSEIYLWEGMKQYIYKFVEECLNCQHAKDKHLKPRGLTQSIEIQTWRW